MINKTRLPYSLQYLFACLLLLTGIVNTHAQEVSFSAAATANKIGIEDQVQVQYVIRNADNLQTLGPTNEINNNFHIVGGPYTSQSSQMSFVNGKMNQSKSITLTYVLQPKKKGKLTIPAAYAKTSDGKTYESNSLPLEVVDGSLATRQPQQQQSDPFGDDPFDAIMRQRQRQRQALQQQRQQNAQPEEVNIDKDLFIKVVVDKSKVYVGEQITASYKLYARIPMNVNISKLPSLNGFWTQDFEMPKGQIKPVEEIVDGQRYQVFTLKKSALFPQQTGSLELDPAEAEGVARVMQQNRAADPFGSFFMDDAFFDDFFGGGGYRDIKVKLKSKPIKIQVSPLPEEGQPEGFGGAVGNFKITSSIDKTELTTDDVINLKLEINGSGNIKLIEAPVLQLPNGLITYDPIVQDTITGRSTTISGTKTITYTIAPKMAGDYSIPTINFSYFNPTTGRYDSAKTQPIKLNVKPGKNYSNEVAKASTLTDIHNIYTSPLKNLSFKSQPMILTVGYWSMYAIPLLALIGVMVWKRREDEMSKDLVSLKRRRANKVALKRLSSAQKLLQQNQRTPFYEEVSKAIWLYLSDKLNIPLSSMSRDIVWDALSGKEIPESIQNTLRQIMDDCETALYAPTGGNNQMQQTYDNAVEIISKLEETFK
ncbi:MAG: protein BatD [Chitinophagales bacterium]|nr:protein BatD [Chitinophagaceae bacterium]MCB9064929.1 protein BatD [Chitinophagales bacterium]